jgi:NADH dehydrogenase/putative oxidoreductase
MTQHAMPAARSRTTLDRLDRLLDLAAVAMRAAAPLADLVVRLALAKAFFAPGMLMPTAAPDSWQLIMLQVAGPLLLAAGLWVRPIALIMLLLTLAAQTRPGAVSAVMHDQHLFWAALFGWYIVQGAGLLSLDHVLQRGLGISPLPFASRAIALAGWSDRVLAPLYRLVLRLWIAAALAAHAVGGTAGAAMMSHAMMAPTVAATMLPASWSLWLALLLAFGVATPVVAAALLAVGTGAALSNAGATIYFPLLLALLATSGAGRISIDALLRHLLRQPHDPPPEAPHIVIVGGGFAGMACAAALRRTGARVTIIDRQNYHLFQPLLYQVATGALSPADIATPIRSVFRNDPQVRVLRATVTGVDTIARRVLLESDALPYDTLVLATGASHGYFGHNDWAALAPGLKSIDDATTIRSRVLAAFEQAEAAGDDARRRVLLTFIVCGAGPTGVELAGAIAELARNGMAKDFRNFDPATSRILLIQGGARVLPSFAEPLSAFALASLRDLGVEVMLGRAVEKIDADGVTVAGQQIAAGTVLWAAGVVASPAARWLGVGADRAGRIEVDPDLSVPGHPDIFAIGDTALSLGWNGKPVPGLAPAAKQQGAYVAALLHARMAGRRLPRPFRYRHQGSLATIGRRSAVAEFGRLRLTGALAWWLWGAVHIVFLAGLRNRFSVMLGWAWSYLTFDIGVRLITAERPGLALPPESPIAPGAAVHASA